jgi:formylglycine-generating enzyme required for sulfatase activity/TPR repeat protein
VPPVINDSRGIYSPRRQRTIVHEVESDFSIVPLPRLRASKTVALLVGLVIATVALPINGFCQSSGTAVEGDQSTASLAETLAWLRKRLPDFAAITYERDAGQNATVLLTTRQRLDLIRFDSCDVRFNKTYETLKVVGEGPVFGDQNLLDGIKINALKSSGVDLSLVDPESVTISPAEATRPGAEPPSIHGRHVWAVNLKGTGTPGSATAIAGSENFLVRDRESAMRIARAFKHAALLCKAQLSSVNAPTAEQDAAAEPQHPEREHPTVRSTFRDCADCPEMVVVPAGGFTMGSPSSEPGRWDNESPQHPVTIGYSFAVGKYPVTRDEYGRFASENSGASNEWQNPKFAQTGRDPVVNVNWDDGKAYALWLSQKTGKPYRLLSEAEYEYAERAGTTTAYWWGDSDSDLCRYANGGPCNHHGTVAVGSYPANGFGLYDMAGNVFEWTEDCWNGSAESGNRSSASGASYAGAPEDGTAWTTGDCGRRVLRGGSWLSDTSYLRSANRGALSAVDRGDGLGFRVARTLVIPSPPQALESSQPKPQEQAAHEKQLSPVEDVHDLYMRLIQCVDPSCEKEPLSQASPDRIQQVAGSGNAEAQFSLSLMYLLGIGVTQDFVESANWCRKAALQGLAPAQARLGQKYLDGSGVEKNPFEALNLYREAAEQGDALAQFSLGTLYFSGKSNGLEDNFAEAAKWYRKAADQGLTLAQVSLGDCYRLGRGVTKDDAQALLWYRKAFDSYSKEAEQGDAQAEFCLSNMYDWGKGGRTGYR